MNISRLWVSLQCLTGSTYWQEWVNIHPGCECLSSVWQDQTHWQDWVRLWVALQCLTRSELLTKMGDGTVMHPGSECLSSVDRLRTTNESRWTCIQAVSSSPVFNRIRIIRSSDESGWTPIQWVSCSPMFEQIRTPDGSGWISTGRQWVLLHLFSRSETLLKMDNIVECIYFDSLS